MNGIHDMGGMHGFGSIEREENEPVFHADWEAHVRAMQALTVGPGYFTLDAFRHGIEQMPPAEYLRSSYYERWLATIEHNLIQQGLLSSDELEARVAHLRDHPDTEPPRASQVTSPPPIPGTPPAISSPATSRFAVGDAVLTRNVHPRGHTRLPRYARGKPGIIHRIYGPQTFPDTNAHGLGEQPQMLYNVRFVGRDLWGDAAGVPETVHLDLWESYLTPAQS